MNSSSPAKPGKPSNAHPQSHQKPKPGGRLEGPPRIARKGKTAAEEEMDERLRTQTFRFTNKFNTDDEFGFGSGAGREESDDSIEEEICISNAGGEAATPVNPKPPLPPSRNSSYKSPPKGPIARPFQVSTKAKVTPNTVSGSGSGSAGGDERALRQSEARKTFNGLIKQAERGQE